MGWKTFSTMTNLCWTLVFLNLIAWNLAEELPSFIHVCHRDDPNMNQCIVAAVEDVRPYLVSGVPEYKIPSLEPLILKDLISEDVQGMKLTTYNVSAYGCSDFFVRNIEADMDTHTFIIDIDLPKLRIEADYRVDGKILLVVIKGNGNLELNITDCSARAVLKGELFESDGDEYMRFTSCDLHVKVGGGNVRLENLFNGDKILLGLITDVVNKNLDAFIKELTPPIEQALSGEFLDIGNKIVETFTYDQLFPH